MPVIHGRFSFSILPSIEIAELIRKSYESYSQIIKIHNYMVYIFQ